MVACTGTANIARLNNAGRIFWEAIGAGAIRTPISSRTQPRQINITASVTLVRNRRDVRLWQKADIPALPLQSVRALPFLLELGGINEAALFCYNYRSGGHFDRPVASVRASISYVSLLRWLSIHSRPL
jgi:hypothetical protein